MSPGRGAKSIGSALLVGIALAYRQQWDTEDDRLVSWDVLTAVPSKRKALQLVDLAPDEVQRARLMEKYQDVPVDLADATLVLTAEARRMRRIFTLDSDFQIYRLRGRISFELVPNSVR
jgi:predicted nucleic acid-binding protein